MAISILGLRLSHTSSHGSNTTFSAHPSDWFWESCHVMDQDECKFSPSLHSVMALH